MAKQCTFSLCDYKFEDFALRNKEEISIRKRMLYWIFLVAPIQPQSMICQTLKRVKKRQEHNCPAWPPWLLLLCPFSLTEEMADLLTSTQKAGKAAGLKHTKCESYKHKYFIYKMMGCNCKTKWVLLQQVCFTKENRGFTGRHIMKITLPS